MNSSFQLSSTDAGGPTLPKSVTRWLRVVLAAATALLVLVFVGYTYLSSKETVRLVRHYLAAVHDGRVEDALDLAGMERPPGEEGRFLSADVPGDGWTVVDVWESGWFGEIGISDVSFTVADRDGKESEYEVHLTHDDEEEWVIESAMPRVRFAHSALWYVDVNGVSAPATSALNETRYALLPGYYTFYGEPPAGVELESETVLVMPGYSLSHERITPEISLNQEGGERVQEAVNAFTDTCTERGTEELLACGLGTDIGDTVVDRDDPEVVIDEFYDLTWSVEEYPEVSWGTEEHTTVPVHNLSPAGRLDLTVEAPGTLSLYGTGHQEGMPPLVRTLFAVECSFEPGLLEAGFTADGEVVVGERDRRFTPLSMMDAGSARTAVTCG